MNELHELFKERVREQRHNMRRRRSRTRRKWIIGWCLIGRESCLARLDTS